MPVLTVICHPRTTRDISGPDWERSPITMRRASFEHIAMSYSLLAVSPCWENSEMREEDEEEFIFTVQVKVSDGLILSPWAIMQPQGQVCRSVFRVGVCVACGEHPWSS